MQRWCVWSTLILFIVARSDTWWVLVFPRLVRQPGHRAGWHCQLQLLLTGAHISKAIRHWRHPQCTQRHWNLCELNVNASPLCAFYHALWVYWFIFRDWHLSWTLTVPELAVGGTIETAHDCNSSPSKIHLCLGSTSSSCVCWLTGAGLSTHASTGSGFMGNSLQNRRPAVASSTSAETLYTVQNKLCSSLQTHHNINPLNWAFTRQLLANNKNLPVISGPYLIITPSVPHTAPHTAPHTLFTVSYFLPYIIYYVDLAPHSDRVNEWRFLERRG